MTAVAYKSSKRKGTPKVSAKWRKILGRIPGYDPFADAAGCWFDSAAAQKRVDFFATFLQFNEGAMAGRPLILEPFQESMVANVFGWKHEAPCKRCGGSGDMRTGKKRGTLWLRETCTWCGGTGTDIVRRYRELFLYVPRKNAKTTFMAGLTNCVLFTDHEQAAQLYGVAGDREQARLCFKIASDMVRADSHLSERVVVYQNSIHYAAENSAYKIVAAEAGGRHGYSPHMAFADELHVHKSADLLVALQTGMVSRRQPLFATATTADFLRQSVCNDKYDYASKVRDGIIKDPAFLPVIFEADPEADWTKESTWKSANPMYGKSVDRDYMKRECGRAMESPGYEAEFKRLHLNIRTEQVSKWLDMKNWNACGSAIDNPIAWRASKLAEFKGQPCYGGLDIGATSDLTALCLAFGTPQTTITLIPFFWIPADGVTKKPGRWRTMYQGFVDQGFVEKTPGSTTDWFGYVVPKCEEVQEQYGFVELGVDPEFQAWAAMMKLQNECGINVVEHRQGYQGMSGPAKLFAEYLLAGKIDHGNNSVLNWMASNVEVTSNQSGMILPKKPNPSSPLKIDGIVAAIMAVGRMCADLQEEEPIPGIYVG